MKSIIALVAIFASLAVITPLSYAQTDGTSEGTTESSDQSKFGISEPGVQASDEKTKFKEERETMKKQMKEQREQVKSYADEQREKVKQYAKEQRTTIEAKKQEIRELLAKLKTSVADNQEALDIISQIEAKIGEIKDTHEKIRKDVQGKRDDLRKDVQTKRDQIREDSKAMKEKIREQITSKKKTNIEG